MQRFFSTFPGRGPGLGLLLLRAVVGGATVIQATSLLVHLGTGQLAASAIALAALIAGTSLVVGFMTPVSGIVAGGTTLALAVSPTAQPFFIGASALLVAVDAIAVVLLGPGAFSLDARLFGRREILIPSGRG